MVRRSPRQSILDDRAFPIRVKFKVPSLGFGMRLTDMDVWLKNELPRGGWAKTSAPAIGEAIAFHFRSLDVATAFIAAFPDLELADAVDSSVYMSPVKAARMQE